MRLVSFAAADEAGFDEGRHDTTPLIRLLVIVVRFDLFLNDSKSHDQQVVC